MTALETAVRILSARERTAVEVRARLAGKGFPPAAIEAAVDRLRSLGYLDDQRCAQTTADRLFAKGQARAQVARKLRAAGIAEPLLAEVLEAAPDDRTLAKRALALRYRGRSVPPPRAARYLGGRGFAVEVIAEVVAEVVGGRGAAPEDT